MGKVIGIIVAVILVIVAILFFVGFFEADVDVDGGFDAPEVEVQGDFDAPDVDMDVEGPDVRIEEETITVPTLEVDPANEGEANAEATDDDPDQR